MKTAREILDKHMKGLETVEVAKGFIVAAMEEYKSQFFSDSFGKDALPTDEGRANGRGATITVNPPVICPDCKLPAVQPGVCFACYGKKCLNIQSNNL
jgi:hypothetical protein